ncbi:SsrA-binding protein SmpB [Patescibacteria group bacterium]|nr:SsrA-binding protein SmpB [Patescibacteria group bacterium]MBU1868338.1 SsrA-binding protein SmpB [Patescibacteria group bacterium]
MPVLATNRKAHYLYQILKKYEAGIQLEGWEVKSIRQRRISIKDSYVKLVGKELYLINAHIAAYQKTREESVKTRRSRKLLVKKNTILYLKGELARKGLTIAPLTVYTKRSLIKLEIALVKGKKGFEKRRKERKDSIRRQAEIDVKEALTPAS